MIHEKTNWSTNLTLRCLFPVSQRVWHAKLKVQLRQLKGELIPAEDVAYRGRELGSAIRTVVTRLHRLATALEGHAAPVIETRPKEAEDEILEQLHTLDDRLQAHGPAV